MCDQLVEKSDDAVRIAVRQRPLRDGIEEEASIITYPERDNKVLVVSDRIFKFDFVLGPETTQQQIFEDLVKPLVAKVKEGFNCTALAYGQTGTGKSYTMGLSSNEFEGEHVGVIPRCLKEILNINANENTNEAIKHEVYASFIEIYNEKVYDLLAENYTEPIATRGQKYTGGTRMPLGDIKACYSILLQGHKNRHVRPTKLNLHSSRSHAIFTIHVHTVSTAGTRYAHLNLVDLAGSEGVRRTGHQGEAMSEGVHINRGLLSIGKVLQAISAGNKVIPYRDSMLSSVLQESFNANSYLTLLACISPYPADMSETLSTLRFAQSTKQLKHTPQLNSILSEIKKNKAKTPYKDGKAQRKTYTPFPQKRTYSQINQNSGNKVPIFHSNTFSTPNKLRCLSGNKLNQTDTGLISKEKQKTQTGIVCPIILPKLPGTSATAGTNVQLLNNRESLLDRTIGSSISLNVSSSTVVDGHIVQTTSYSPLVRRCMTEMENIMENKMLHFIEKFKDITQEQNRPRSITEQSTPIPTILRQELKSIVKEVLTDTIVHKNELNADDTVSILLPSAKHNAKSQLFTTSSPVFKVPQPPGMKRKTNITNVDMSLEDGLDCFADNLNCFTDEMVHDRVERRSQRTSEGLQTDSIDKTIILNDSLRRSRRISTRNANMTSTILESTLLLSDTSSSTSRTGGKRKSLKQLHAERRRSVRLAARLEVPKTNMKTNKSHSEKPRSSRKANAAAILNSSYYTEYEKNTSTSKNDNIARHRRAVLKLLNVGTMKQLQLLPQVGPKTAYQLVTQRTLNGKFKSLAHVEKLPIWRGSSWQRFAEANVLL